MAVYHALRHTFGSRSEQDYSGIFWLLIHYALNSTGLSPVVAGNVAKVISTAVASTLSYFVQRYFVFPREG